MWGFLRLVTFCMGVQTALSTIRVQQVRVVRRDKKTSGHRQSAGLDAAMQKASTKNNVRSTDVGRLAVVTGGEGQRLADADRAQQSEALFTWVLVIVIIIASTQPLNEGETTRIIFTPTVTDPEGNSASEDIESDLQENLDLEMDIDESFLNDDGTGLCPGCTLDVEAGDCISNCDNYDKDAVNEGLDFTPSVRGDPHMVGLLGQKFDWAGTDNQWYCLISDGPELQFNVRVTAPMPQEFPDRQLVSAVSILTQSGPSLEIAVKNPYSTETDGCPDHQDSLPCLANGALRILVDDKEFDVFNVPGVDVALPGGMTLSATNLPAQCQPFGGDRIWAAQYADMVSGTRNLRASPRSLEDWILDADTLAAPTWCAKFVEEEGLAGLLKLQSSHAIFRIETDALTLRINFGINYQDLVTAPDGITTVLPELEFWQADLGVERAQLSDSVDGMLGETSRMVLDENDLPVMQGLRVLRGSVESYRVDGPLGIEFEQLHK